MRKLCCGGVFVCLLAATGALGAAGTTGSLTGRVTTADGKPASDAAVQLLDLHRAITVRSGAFRAEDVPAGEHRLLATSSYGAAVETVSVTAGATANVDIQLSPLYHDEVVVSAGADRPASQAVQPVAVVNSQDLDLKQQTSLGATIRNEPGVSTTYFGPAVGRPIVRGLGGDRVRILTNGTDDGDLSGGAPDHAVNTEVTLADRVEIVRGAATLLYGSSAEGGVVNVIDGRVPETRPGRTLTGHVAFAAGSVADERNGSVLLDGQFASNLAWHLGAFRRQSNDYKIPGGVLLNSAVENENDVLGVSWIGSNGFFGIAGTRIEGTFGLPGNLEDGSGDPKDIRHQKRLDVRTEWRLPLGIFETIRADAGINAYHHVEAENSSLFGTLNQQESWEGRVEARQKAIGGFGGTMGVQVRRRDVSIIGEEAFVPASVNKNVAAFALEQLDRANTHWEAGVRYESQTIGGDPDVAPHRSYRGWSASAGMVWTPRPAYAIAVSLTHAMKFPSAEELYTNGAHVATRAFEIGNADLGEEIDHGVDVSLRRVAGRVTGELNLFVNRFRDFIYQQFTPEVREELPVLLYAHGNSTFRGGELRASASLVQTTTRLLALDLGADVVRAQLSTGEPLPRIPPLRYGIGLRYDESGRLWGELSAWRTTRQNRLAPLETPTDGYTIVNAGIGVRMFAHQLAHDLLLRVSNAGNAEIRPNTSFLKELAPEPGRDVTVSYRVTF